MIIKIKNWGKYNPKRDQSTYTWLRLNNDLPMDQHLFEFTPAQKYGWVVLLCLASKKNDGEINLGNNADSYFAHLTGIEKGEVVKLFKMIEERGLATFGGRGRSKTTPTYVRTNERTNVTNKELFHSSSTPPVKPTKVSAQFEFKFDNVPKISIPLTTSKRLVDLYGENPGRAWMNREIKKCVGWYQDNNRMCKSPKGWANAISSWLERSWVSHSKGNGAHKQGPKTFNQQKMDNLKKIKEEIDRGEI